MADRMIEVEGLTKFYGDFLAVSGVSFSVDRGETVGLLGTNGSGKTTTMRVLTGYMPPTSGTVRIAGHDLAADSLEARRHIGYLPESVPLYSDMTVAASLRFFGRVHSMGAASLASSIDRVLDAFDLVGYRDTLVGKLSKGYRQRLGLALAVLHEPEVLVLDEPTVSIDPVQVVEARDLIRRLGKEHTVLLSTHQLAEASTLCERVIILHDGILVAEGHPDEIAGRLQGAQRIRVEARGPAEQTGAALAAVPGVRSVGTGTLIEEGVYAFEVTAPMRSDLREAIAQAMNATGIGLRGLARSSVDLEEVFLQITRGERENPDA
ncbi:MAG: ABC transporter ATP-binding protein [Chloroflexota bacterium]|nr:ABC transporter ATP-binding protein [Chloroflexota bacterium]